MIPGRCPDSLRAAPGSCPAKISSESMPTLMQKIRLAFRGWQRRREEREKEFLTRNASWGVDAPGAVAAPAKTRTFAIDMEGLTVAYLDDSGQLAHFLDTSDGEIVDVRIAEAASYPEPRFRRLSDVKGGGGGGGARVSQLFSL